ncbi:MAG: tyrosine-protein phosphatase [Acetobacteraceae bacterium]|nr:tyrosine-protein phosphatase [Acetobacteraceae bacterium]
MIGAVTLRLLGRNRIIQGGPFDDFQPPAIGVCLEVRSLRVAEAALVLPVVDYGAPDAAELTAALRDVLALMATNPDLPVYIGCRAGIGRTGMMIAALAKLAGIANPIAWVRAHYHPDAVETSDQHAVIEALDPAMI